MARVRCVTMQRDEDQLLEPWLRWYGYLFGFESLCVFDHGSILPEVVDTLDRYERLGVEVRRDLRSPNDFRGMAAHFHNMIRHWDNEGDYDFVFPLACDEFLALFDGTGVVCSRARIHAVLDALPQTGRVFGLDLSLFNVPGRPGWFVPETHPKGFAARAAVADMDHGFHAIAAIDGQPPIEAPFVYLHHHYKPLERTRAHARHKLDGLVDPDDAAALADYTGPGMHLAKHFRMDAKQYASQFDDRLLVQVPGFGRLLAGLGVTDPNLAPPSAPGVDGSIVLRLPKRRGSAAERRIKFDPAQYVARNPDVAIGGVDPLKHFLLFGHREKREI